MARKAAIREIQELQLSPEEVDRKLLRATIALLRLLWVNNPDAVRQMALTDRIARKFLETVDTNHIRINHKSLVHF